MADVTLHRPFSPPPWYSGPLRRGVALLSLGMLASCSAAMPAEEPEDLEAVGRRSDAITDVIPTSRDCQRAASPSGCVMVPPTSVKSAPLPRLCTPGQPCPVKLPEGVDGVRAEHEYDAATTLPYTDMALRANGKIYARAFKYERRLPPTQGGGTRLAGYLKLFLEGIPLKYVRPSGEFNDPESDSGLVVIGLDRDRFTGPDQLPEASDVFYLVDLYGVRPAQAFQFNRTTKAFESAGAAAFHAGSCDADPSTPNVMRCNGELQVALGDGDLRTLALPDEDVEPGVGLTIVPMRTLDADVFATPPRAALPEAAATARLVDVLLDRRYAVSLLLGTPKGHRLKYMSWNIKRSSIGALGGPYQDVPDADLGKFLADKADVIALQEGWNVGQVEAIVKAANDFRATLGKPAFVAYGPNDEVDSAWRMVVGSVGGGFTSEGSSSGLWILSSLPAAATGFKRFSTCMGEDCFKAKGVMWVRLMMNPPNGVNDSDACAERLYPNKLGTLSRHEGRGCGAPPSGAEYVDVFTTHTQSPDPVLCGDSVWLAAVKIAFPFTIPEFNSDMNCGETDYAIQEKQVEQIDQFIEASTADNRDRPSIVMGDFNINGRNVDHAAISHYGKLLDLLHIGARIYTPTGERSDAVNPIGTATFDWDIEHGDLAREWNTPWPAGGECMGTTLGDDELTANPHCASNDFVDGVSRIDYIFVRPPKPIDAYDYVSPRWYAKRSTPYSSPPPGVGVVSGDTVLGPPTRLSDHKPVLVGIEHVKLDYLPSFHAGWRHDVEFRVNSLNVSNRGDGAASGNRVDPYSQNYGGHYDAASGSWTFTDQGRGHECENRGIVAWPADLACLGDWSYRARHEPGVQSKHAFGPHLWDADSVSDDKLLMANGGTWGAIVIDWSTGLLRLGDAKSAGLDFPALEAPISDWRVFDNAPLPRCTNSNPANTSRSYECLMFAPKELPPGQQF